MAVHQQDLAHQLAVEQRNDAPTESDERRVRRLVHRMAARLAAGGDPQQAAVEVLRTLGLEHRQALAGQGADR